MELPIKLSDEDLQTIITGVSEWLAPHVGQKPPKRNHVLPAALNAYETARYLGVSRPRFYELLKVDQGLAAAVITIGTKRLWPIVFLDEWLARHKGKTIVPRRLPAEDRSGICGGPF